MIDPQDLVTQYADYAASLARQISKDLPGHVSFDDLKQYALLGLTEAAHSYNPEAGATFTTFSYYRVRGAVFDGISKMSGITPAMRRKIVLAEKTNQTLADASTGAAAATSPDDLLALADQAIGQTAMIFVASQLGDGEAAIEPVDAETPADRAEHASDLGQLKSFVAQLPPEQQQLVDLLYVQSLSITEAAAKLGKHKSNVSRAHDKLLLALRGLIEPNGSS